MNAGTMRIDLLPQGSLAEMIRAGGAGLGGTLTKPALARWLRTQKIMWSGGRTSTVLTIY